MRINKQPAKQMHFTQKRRWMAPYFHPNHFYYRNIFPSVTIFFIGYSIILRKNYSNSTSLVVWESELEKASWISEIKSRNPLINTVQQMFCGHFSSLVIQFTELYFTNTAVNTLKGRATSREHEFLMDCLVCGPACTIMRNKGSSANLYSLLHSKSLNDSIQ